MVPLKAELKYLFHIEKKKTEIKALGRSRFFEPRQFIKVKKKSRKIILLCGDTSRFFSEVSRTEP